MGWGALSLFNIMDGVGGSLLTSTTGEKAHRSCVLMRQIEQLPLGASVTSIVVCTTPPARGPSGAVGSRAAGAAGRPAASVSAASGW